MDKGHELTEGILDETEREINEIYKEAHHSAKVKADEYFKKFAERDALMKQKVDNGEMTEDEYKQWRVNKMVAGARYKAMEESLATDLTNADKLAASTINGHLPDVYATNYNWSTYDIEQDARIDTNFVLYDRQTVERLVRDKPDLIPMKAAVSIPEDMRWNKKHINNAITQGVLLGESIPDIAKRLAAVTDMNRKSAIRNARTMTTSAENGGRVDSYKRATDMGIKIKQEWLATKDNRTRHEHAMLNGQEVDVGKPFKVEGYEIRFPGDPEAEPHLVYNCRCCLISNFKGFDYKKMDKFAPEPKMEYEEWQEQHEVEKPKEQKLPRPKTKNGWAYKTGDGYYGSKQQAIEEINNYVDNAPRNMQTLWQMNGKKLQAPINVMKSEGNKAYFSHDDYRVHLNPSNVMKGDTLHKPFQTHFHEYMHNIDYLNRKSGHEMFTDGWRDKDGNKLEDIIMKEWRKKFTITRTDEEIARVLFLEQLEAGGVGAEQFVKSEFAYWKRHSKLKRDNPEYKALKAQLDSCQNSREYWQFYKANASLLVDDTNKELYREEIDKNAVKSYIKNIRAKYSLQDRGDLSDMMERFTVMELDMDRPLGAGHGKSYALTEGKLSRESFAEMGDSSFTNPKSLELIKQELPETYAAWEGMIAELTKGAKK